MNLDLFHCLHVILYVCNLANMITSTEGSALVDTITDGYDLSLASRYHVKEGINVTMLVKSQSSLHRNTYVHKYRNNKYKLTSWMSKQRQLMARPYSRYEKVDGKNGNTKLEESVPPANGLPIDKHLDLLLLHYPATHTRIKRDLSRTRRRSAETNVHNQENSRDVMTLGERVIAPVDYDSNDKSKAEAQQRRILGITPEIMKRTGAPEVVPTSPPFESEQISYTAEQIPETEMQFKKNPVPNQKDGKVPCLGCQMHFVPTFDEPDKQDSIPGVNLTIVPLGAIFIFLIFFCCKTFHWAVYDFRERDDSKELQVMKPRIVHPRKQSIFITRQSSTSSSSGFGTSTDSHSKLESGKLEPSNFKSHHVTPHGLRYAALVGLLPGVGMRNANWTRPGLSISYESEISKDNDMGGTSPVRSACVAAAMTANIPMAVAFTLRQISNEKRESIKRKKKLSFSTTSGLEWSPSHESEKSSKSMSPKPFVHDTSADSVVPGSQSDSLSFELPKPTWPRDKKIRAKRNTNSNKSYHMNPTIEDGIEVKNGQKTSKNSSLVPNSSTPNTSEISDLDNSAPSSPMSSSQTSIASILSDTSVSIKTASSDRDSQDFALSEGLSPLSSNDSSSLEKPDESGKESKEPSSSPFDRLKSETAEPGTYNANFAKFLPKMYLHYSPLTEPCNIITVAEVHKPLLGKDRTDTNHNSSRSHSCLSVNEKKSALKENKVQEKFNDISNDNDEDTNVAPYLNGHTKHWLCGVNTVHEMIEETQV